MEKEMVQSQWFKISAFNTQPLFAFGTDQEAKTYVDLLNIDREINVYSASEIPADQCAALDSGDDTDGFRLDLAIDTIRENRLEQARAEAAMRRLD